MQVSQIDARRPYGVVIEGLCEGDLDDNSVCENLCELWTHHGLMIFRGEVSNSFHIRLSRVFGELETHPVREALSPENPDIIDIRYDPEREAIWEVDGEQLGGWLPWHSDLIYVDRINHGGILRAIELPAEGGLTGFIDRIEAYGKLPDDLKQRIEDLSIVYQMNVDFGEMPYVSRSSVKLARSSPFIDSARERSIRDFPLVVHPVVYRQPETGRRVLNVSPMSAMHILGMDNPEGHDLLRELVDYASDESLAYYHQWNCNEMVLWDNWRLLHSATGCAPGETRYMKRTTIAGDYGCGRKLKDLVAEPAI